MPTPAAALRRIHLLEPGIDVEEPCPPHLWKKSPNYKNRGVPIDTIVLHATAGASTAGALSVLLSPASDASAHLIIPDDSRAGEPQQTLRLVEDAKAAWHVRRSCLFQGRTDVNARSLGVEIVNSCSAGDAYTDWQIAEVVRWCRYWMSQYPIRYLVTHAYIDPARRRDPCETFPWDRFLQQVTHGLSSPNERTLPTLLLEGKPLALDLELDEGAVWVPLRPLVEALGGSVTYDAEKNRVTILPKKP
jgi:N-acetylmuramoyl-L-alanine amidase